MRQIENNKNNNQSLAKALKIIELMIATGHSMRLHDIASELGYPASTVLRFLITFEQFNYVKQNPDTQKYSPTLKLSHLGQMVSDNYDMRKIARPYLAKLVSTVGESACLAIEENHKVLYVDVHDGPDSIIKVTQRIGKEAPLHCTGVGKLLLTNYSEHELNELAQTQNFEKLTSHTITSITELISEINQVSSVNYATDDQECELGVRCVAAPIRDKTSKVIACISVSGPVSRMTYKKMEFIRTHVMNTANQISKESGFIEI